MDLRHRPGTAAVEVVTLQIGTGADSRIFLVHLLIREWRWTGVDQSAFDTSFHQALPLFIVYSFCHNGWVLLIVVRSMSVKPFVLFLFQCRLKQQCSVVRCLGRSANNQI